MVVWRETPPLVIFHVIPGEPPSLNFFFNRSCLNGGRIVKTDQNLVIKKMVNDVDVHNLQSSVSQLSTELTTAIIFITTC